MLYTFHYILFLYARHGLRHHGLVALCGQTHELLRSQYAKVGLDLAEHKLYRIELRTIWDVVYPTKSQVPHGLLGAVRGVRRKVVTEDRYLGVWVRRS